MAYLSFSALLKRSVTAYVTFMRNVHIIFFIKKMNEGVKKHEGAKGVVIVHNLSQLIDI